MAPMYNAVVVPTAVDSVKLDIELSQRAAALLVHLQPRKDSVKVVHELLGQLEAEKLAREARGLNHWSEHAPKFLSLIVRQARRDKQRRYQEAEAFCKARHSEIVRFAQAIVKDRESAEIVASETYRELLEGGATIPGFFAALVCNARNHLAREAYRRGKFVEIQEALAPNIGTSDNPDAGADWLIVEPPSSRLEDQDPLDILIAREEEEERQRMLTAAKKDPRWRYIKRRDWAAPLLGDVRS